MIADKKRKLLEKSMSENSLLIMVGKSESLRNGDVYYPFRQDSDFLMLTGLNVPDLKLIAKKENGKVEWILYSDPISEKEKLWGTSRLSHENLQKRAGIKEIRNRDNWGKDILVLAQKMEKITIRESDENAIVRGFLKHRHKFVSLENSLLSLRMIKMDEEIENMKKAISVTKIALEMVQNNISSYQFEREIEADIAMVYRKHGCSEAYPTIVASGGNACILHYTQYERKIEDGDLILIDTGAEFEGYAADITRIFVKGKMSERKQAVYNAVRNIQKESIDAIRPGRTWDEHERIMRDIINNHLIGLGLIPKNCKKDEQEMLSRKYFPHRMSHFLGLDVHDSGERNQTILAGMVITCEPGIYIREEGIGVRIEDDIFITHDGCEVLSREIAK